MRLLATKNTTHNFGAPTGIKVRETEFCHEYRTRRGNTSQNIGLSINFKLI